MGNQVNNQKARNVQMDWNTVTFALKRTEGVDKPGGLGGRPIVVVSLAEKNFEV